MPRVPRPEYPGALYHVFDHAAGEELLFRDVTDRLVFLSILGGVVAGQGWRCYAWCLMGNHYHLLLETPSPGISAGMRLLKSTYSAAFNRRHGRFGALFRSRFGAPLVLDEAHLLEVCRYVVLNPVRAGLVPDPGRWPWSSFRATVGWEPAPPWLARREVLATVTDGTLDPRRGYHEFVMSGIRMRPPDLRRLARRM